MLTEDFAEAAKLEKALKFIEETTEAARAEEKALEKSRKNRWFFGFGPLYKDVLYKIGNSQYQRDCHYETADRFKEELKTLRHRIAAQETVQANEQATTDMVDTLGRIGSKENVPVLRPLQFKSRVLNA
jgi:hypothetical protein